MKKNFDYKCFEQISSGSNCFDSQNGKRIPLLSKKGGVKRVVGREIFETSRYLGSYGMGGPGFFGFRLGKKGRYPEEWLVLTIWGADNWLLIDKKWLSCTSHLFSSEKCYFDTYETCFSDAEKQTKNLFDGLTITNFKL
jgi:hypothetical protein